MPFFKFSQFGAILSFVLLMTSCGSTPSYQIDSAVPSVRTTGKSFELIVATQDQRPSVISGKKLDTYIGIFVGGDGERIDVKTASGKPLALDISKAVAAGLRAAGHKVDVVETQPSARAMVALEKVVSLNSRSVFLTILEWRIETQPTANVYYDLSLALVARDGWVSARRRVRGVEPFSTRQGDGAAYESTQAAVSQIMKHKLEELLSNPEVAQQL